MDTATAVLLILTPLIVGVASWLVRRGSEWPAGNDLPNIRPATAQEAAEAVCRIATDHYRSDLSLGQLRRRARYRRFRSEITIEQLAQILQGNRELVQSWIDWFEDKRSQNAWYFGRDDDGWFVRQWPNGVRIACQDEIEACATFILREINGPLAWL